jgi:hypothetical protein
MDSGEGGDVSYSEFLALGGADGTPPLMDSEARLRNLSNAEPDGAAAVVAGADGAILETLSRLLENISKAFIRLEIPEETLTFFAITTGTGRTGCALSK